MIGTVKIIIVKNLSVAALTLIVCFASLVAASNAHAAGAKLVILTDESINIYSGPSVKYRPLASAHKGQSYPVSLRRVPGKNGGEFYKVLVMFVGGQKRIGYIDVNEKVQIEGSDQEVDVDSFESLALSKSSLQLSFMGLKNGTYEVALGYVVYAAPSFYFKGFAGQVVNAQTGNGILGGEIGLDHLVRGAWSIYGLVNGGVELPASNDAVFPGNNQTSGFMQGGFGARFSAGEYAAVSAGVVQSAFFNNNNGFVSTGYMATLEVGL
jgi:hypothetical protein